MKTGLRPEEHSSRCAENRKKLATFFCCTATSKCRVQQRERNGLGGMGTARPHATRSLARCLTTQGKHIMMQDYNPYRVQHACVVGWAERLGEARSCSNVGELSRLLRSRRCMVGRVVLRWIETSLSYVETRTMCARKFSKDEEVSHVYVHHLLD